MSDCDVSAMEEYMAGPPPEKGMCGSCNKYGVTWSDDRANEQHVGHCDCCGYTYTVSDEEVYGARWVPWWDAA